MEETNQTELLKDDSTTKKTNYFPIIGILVVLVLIFSPGLLNSKKDTKSLPTQKEQSSPTPAPTEVANGEIIIEAGSFYYKPNLITVKKGEKVKLTLSSVSMMHDFNIDELGVKVPITKSGSTSTVEFTPSVVGEFEFYCSVGQHRQNGQIGKFIVTE